MCHGGPFDEPENVGKALQMMPGIAGFYGASSTERLPTERAIKAQLESFKGLAPLPVRPRTRACREVAGRLLTANARAARSSNGSGSKSPPTWCRTAWRAARSASLRAGGHPSP
jgi:hypothetical protein